MSDDACEALEKTPVMIHRGIIDVKNDKEITKIIFCTPQGDTRILSDKFLEEGDIDFYNSGPLNDPKKTPTKTFTLEEAVKLSGPKIKIQLLPGKYYKPIKIRNKYSSKKAPIKISGMGKRTILCGSNDSDNIYPKMPGMSDFAFIKIKNTDGVFIENLHVEACWPCFVIAKNCQNVHVSDTHIEDGRYPIFAYGSDSEDFEISNNYWKQDTSEAIWQDIDWEYTHHAHYSGLNGALFGSVNFRSGLIFSENTIEYAFNGLRMTISDRAEEELNLNVQVFRNTFNYIRDNAIEPERHALNWHIYHNKFFNNHAPFSFDNVKGGHWLIYGNIGWFNDQPGLPYQSGRGGKIYKFNEDATTTQDSYIFNNSWYTRSFVIKKSNINNFHHFNNAYQFCDPDEYLKQPCVCVKRASFTKKFPLDKGDWPSNLDFDYDISSIPFGKRFGKYNQEKDGIVCNSFEFIESRVGNLRLKKGSPAFDAGKSLSEVYDLSWVDGSDGVESSSKIDIGAYQGDKLTLGPNFKKC